MWKCKQAYASKLLRAKKEKYWEPGISMFFFYVLWKTSMTFETCLVFMLYVNYGFTDNKQILHKASIFVHAHVD